MGIKGTWIFEHPIRGTDGGKSIFIRHHSTWIVVTCPLILAGLVNRWWFFP